MPVTWQFLTGATSNQWVVVSLVNGPVNGELGKTQAINGSVATRLGSVMNGDVATQLRAGAYRVKVSLYEGNPCSGNCVTVYPIARLLAEDTSDGWITIAN